jgi:hypothetical protein
MRTKATPVTQRVITIVWSRLPQLEAKGVNHQGVIKLNKTDPITMMAVIITKAISFFI